MRQIKVTRSEWFTLDAKDARFDHMDSNTTITGEQWLDLCEEDQNEYFINTISASMDSMDGDIDYFEVEEYTGVLGFAPPKR